MDEKYDGAGPEKTEDFYIGDEPSRLKELERLVEIQRDICRVLGESRGFREYFDRLLAAILKIEGIDCGGVYIVHESTGELDLVSHAGLSGAFIEEGKHFAKDSYQARLVREGKPVYGVYNDVAENKTGVRIEEGLLGLAVIPILFEGRVVAALNLASKGRGEIPQHARHIIESVAGQIGGMVARVRAERRAREERKNLESLFNALDDLITVLDSGGKVIHFNSTVARRLGYSESELGKMHVLDLHPPERRQEAAAVVADMLEGKTSLCSIPLMTKSGDLIPVETIVTRGKWDGETVLFGISRDVSERQKAQEEVEKYKAHLEELVKTRTEELTRVNEKLRLEIGERERAEDEHRKFKIISDAAGYGNVITDLAGKILYVNEAFSSMHGYEPGELEGESVGLLDAGEDSESFSKLMIGLKVSGAVKAREISTRTFSGPAVPCLFNAAAIPDERGGPRFLFASLIDLTEQKSMETRLRHSQKMEAVGTLAGGVAHDFNNLLQAIHGYADLILMDLDKTCPSHREAMEIIRAAKRGEDLTRSLLTFSRRVESKFRPIDLNHSAKQVLKLLARTMPKSIELQSNLARSLKTVNADPAQIEQVLMNLTVNAKDALPRGGVITVSTENVTLGPEYAARHVDAGVGEHVALTVSDNGTGMEAETLEHIFEPFFTTKAPGKGTGLGLSLVFGIVKNHGGHVTCRSEPDIGTTFQVYFPVIQALGEVPDSALFREDGAEGGKETVLIVDDEENIRDIARRMLSSAGYEVLTAPDGQTALEIYKAWEKPVDLVVLDYIMPGMDGKLCAEELWKIDPAARIVFASGYISDGPVAEVAPPRARGSLKKPFGRIELLRIVRDVLNQPE